jgi:hypothetical protein
MLLELSSRRVALACGYGCCWSASAGGSYAGQDCPDQCHWWENHLSVAVALIIIQVPKEASGTVSEQWLQAARDEQAVRQTQASNRLA